jgi:acetylornithine/succinyldiaminopimelate/putrescine aminotransferase
MKELRYRATTKQTLRTIQDLNNAGRPNILFAGLAITAEAAQSAYLISRLHSLSADHITHFSNSIEEAISGAVKLARHSRATARTPDQGRSVLIVDTSGDLQDYFNPSRSPASDSHVPNLIFVASFEHAMAVAKSRDWCAIITTINESDDDGCAAILSDVARSQGALYAVADRRPIAMDSGDVALPAAQIGCDVRIYGENLTDYQVPFGCFTMSYDAYKVWNNPIDAFTHSSTFAANAVVLTIMIETLRRKGYVTKEHEQAFARIRNDRRTRNIFFGKYINPISTLVMESFNHDFEFEHAEGGTMTLRDGRRLIDCASGTGANLRGHNPQDLYGEVLAVHDPEKNYVKELTEKLYSITGFDDFFPAVSGATSVELALALAQLARPERRKIVTFRGNFSGRTLAAQNVSRYGPQRSASLPDAFAPYYPYVTFLDLNSPTVAADLSLALSDPEVGLLWCELIQGYECIKISEDIQRIITQAKVRNSILVGIDEVLTGVWRASDTEFLYHQSTELVADLVTIAKPLSDMTLPIGGCLVRSSVVDEIASINRDPVNTIELLRRRYHHNLSAHIALHALEAVDRPDMQSLRIRERTTLSAGLSSIAPKSRLYSSVSGSGALLRLTLNRRYFPCKPNSVFEELIDTSLEELIIDRCGVLLGRGRFFPAVFPEEGHAVRLVAALQAGIPEISVLSVYWNLVSKLARLAINAFYRRYKPAQLTKRQLSGSIAPSRGSGEWEARPKERSFEE